jgi:lambda family phage portal protein
MPGSTVANYFRTLLQSLAGKTQEPAPARKTQTRMYAAARPSRLTSGFASGSTSANSELHSSLRALRDRSRQLVRDSAYAKRAKKIVVDNVIGTGIGMQAGVKSSRGELRKAVNTAISDAFWTWCNADSCHTGGQLHFCDLERQLMGQVFDSGEILIRLHPMRFGNSAVPLALEIIEAERLADDIGVPSAIRPDLKVIDGIEVDSHYRPVNYLIKQIHPGDHRMTLHEQDRVERVPADQIIHLRIIDRWPQVRGEPWLHAVIRKLADIDGYTEAEIVAARAGAMYFGTITTDESTASLGEEQEDGTFQLPLEPGMIEKLRAGEKLDFVSPNRPNSALDPFLRYMLREMASGIPGVSYETLSSDYAQSNYSSSRMGLLDSRDAFRAIQQWFIRSFRERLHNVWLQQAVLSGAIPEVSLMEYTNDPSKFQTVNFKPRGWSWVDPSSEVEAYKDAVRCGFMTVGDVVAQTANGADREDVWDERKRELDDAHARDLVFDSDPTLVSNAGLTQARPQGTAIPSDEVQQPIPAMVAPKDDAVGDEPKRVIPIRR